MTTILLLEDNANMLAMLSQVLEWGGYSVIGGRSGYEGIARLTEAHRLPDIIISDLLMPGMDGIGFLRQVRENPDWADIPFVMMSAYSSSDERQNAIQHGANDFLVKPFSLEDFQAVLNRWQR
ncbi:MAG: response regulator [Aggregatilineales bacterium]